MEHLQKMQNKMQRMALTHPDALIPAKYTDPLRVR